MVCCGSPPWSQTCSSARLLEEALGGDAGQVLGSREAFPPQPPQNSLPQPPLWLGPSCRPPPEGQTQAGVPVLPCSCGCVSTGATRMLPPHPYWLLGPSQLQTPWGGVQETRGPREVMASWSEPLTLSQRESCEHHVTRSTFCSSPPTLCSQTCVGPWGGQKVWALGAPGQRRGRAPSLLLCPLKLTPHIPAAPDTACPPSFATHAGLRGW